VLFCGGELQGSNGAPLPTSPRWGEESEIVGSPTLMTFLIDDNVSCTA